MDPVSTKIKDLIAINLQESGFRLLFRCSEQIFWGFVSVNWHGSLYAVNRQGKISGSSEVGWQNYTLIAKSFALHHAAWL